MTLYGTHGGSPEQTIVKPTPGGRRPSAAPARPVEAAPSYRAEDVADLTAGGINPLAAAAGPILGLVRRLMASVVQNNVDLLRERVIAEIRTFEKRVLAANVPPEAARAAHYALCATLDDVVLNTPWGNHSSWTRNGMVSTFHLDVSGGERFFDAGCSEQVSRRIPNTVLNECLGGDQVEVAGKKVVGDRVGRTQ